MGIMTMLALVYVANFRGFQQGLAVQSDADHLAGSIRQAQIWALTGELVNGSRPDGGYGIYIPSPCMSGVCSFTVFANTCTPSSYVFDSGCDTVIRTDNLNDLVDITGAAPAGPLTLIFTPPSAEIYANNVKSASASVTLAHRYQTAKTQTIAVDGVSGQVNVQ